MASLDFFAAKTDQNAIIEFLLSSTDVRIFESYSEPDHEIREFKSLDDLAAAFEIGSDKYGNGLAVLLQLWSPSVMQSLEITRFDLRPEFCDGHTFRYRIDGGALIQLYFGGVYNRVITKSHLGHNSEIRAKKWGASEGVNWQELKKLSNKIQYHIRKRLAVAKVPGRPVLTEAFALARDGFSLKEAAQTPWDYKLDSAKANS